MKHTHLLAFFLTFLIQTAKATEPQIVPCQNCESAAQILESKGKIWLSACEKGASAYVFDSKGSLVEQFELLEGDNFFAADKLEAGVYIAVLTEKSGATATFSIAKS